MKKRQVYLDYSASTPVDPAVIRKMMPYFSERFGNPSSLHRYGQEGRKAVEKARQQIADFLGCSTKEVIFTSGATESNDWAIKSSIKLFLGKGRPHIITSSIEHYSVFEMCHWLKKQGVDVTFLPVSKEGLINPKDVAKAVKKNTILVSIIHAHNEIGVVQPIKEIAKVIKEKNSQREANKIVFHIDAGQAINYLDCRINNLGVDMLTIDSHKIYGPKGAGALYIRSGVYLEPLIGPGSQEFGLRPGTENVTGVVGLGEAIKRIKANGKNNQLTRRLRDKLIKGVLETIPDSKLNGSWKYRLPNNANFSFIGAEGESILMALSQRGIYVSTGSACASHSLKPSHILLAIGLTPEEAHCSVRFTLGRQITGKDIDYVLEVLPAAVARLRKISGK